MKNIIKGYKCEAHYCDADLTEEEARNSMKLTDTEGTEGIIVCPFHLSQLLGEQMIKRYQEMH